MKHTLLIADGDRDLCDLYGKYFALQGYDVETAHDAVECLTKLRQIQPAMLIVEKELPRGGGESVLDSMSEQDHLRSIPVILVNTYLALNRPPETRNPMVYFSFLKPCRLGELWNCVRTILTPKEQNPQLAEAN